MSVPDSGGSRRGFYAWVAFALLATAIVTALVFGWAVRHALTDGPRLSPGQKRIVLAAANFPGLVREAFGEINKAIKNDPVSLLVDRRAVEGPHWRRSFPAPEDPGYLLFSGVDPAAHHSLVKLIRISDGREIARWDPDWPAIYAKITEKRTVPRGSPANGVAMHPLILENADIVFNTNHSLVRLGPCSRTPVWVLDKRMHHSNELDADGTIWTPSESTDAFADNPWMRDRLRDDALARVAPDGRVLEVRSFGRIMRENGLTALLIGTSGWKVQPDPLHINEIMPAPSDTRFWQRGDLLVSSRHLSTVFLYRPSTGKIIWHQTGPWLNQHSPAFVDDHRISVFDNNVYAPAPKEYAFPSPGEANRVFVHDFVTGESTQPYADLLSAARPMTITHGLARLLPDGGLFVEDSNHGRHLRFTRDRLMWSRVNDYDGERIGVVSWSRYLTPEEAAAPLKALEARQCPRS